MPGKIDLSKIVVSWPEADIGIQSFSKELFSLDEVSGLECPQPLAVEVLGPFVKRTI
ncbi:hypothetical protein [Rubripirellula lacrimiformis]|uniref:hypothetical protein n=1 Tax=Rubripirellula lacrimiformis TaxID=1930273 RepID=UPI001C54FD8B|nr:hypothetical protein [Rubripirellula lacrimiformis]